MPARRPIKYLGVDWGGKRIGLAIADGETRMASPYGTVEGVSEVLKIIKAENIAYVVVGEPVPLGGGAGRAPAYRDFVRALERKSAAAVRLTDERLSSRAADALPGGRREKADRDALAAMLILQSYLDRLGKGIG